MRSRFNKGFPYTFGAPALAATTTATSLIPLNDGSCDVTTIYTGDHVHPHPGGLRRQQHHVAEHLRAGDLLLEVPRNSDYGH